MKWKISLCVIATFFLLIVGSGFFAHHKGTEPVAANLQTRAGEISSKSDHAADSAKALRVQESYGKLPLSFIENQGQSDDAVKFLERGHGHSVFFTPDGVVFAFQKAKKDDKEAGAPVMKLAPLGMNKDVHVMPEDRQQGIVNYFIGNDPAKWRTSIPTYGAVLYKEAYPGVDIKFYGNNRQIEYDIIVKPGVDPSQVNFRYSGVANAIVNAAGDLAITLADGRELMQKKPLIYQETDGKRLPLEGGFVIETTKSASALVNPDIVSEEAAREEITQQPGSIEFTCGFKIASYDSSKKLIIDPVLVYSTYLGGSGGDSAAAIAVDSSGNAYVTGYTESSDFPVVNPIYPNLRGLSNAFITKINSSGTALIYSTYLGGSGGQSGGDSGAAIAVDSSGNAYVTGITYSTDFPVKTPLYPNLRGSHNAFVTKINASGTALVYSTYLGGSNYDDGCGIAVDGTGNAYVTGSTWSSDFPAQNPLYPNLRSYYGNAFITKINSSGTALIYSTYLGGSYGDYGYAIAVDGSGNAYVTGETVSSDFPVENPLFPNLQGYSDAFVTKINSSGTALVYSTYLGGSSGNDSGFAIAVDASGNACVTGYTSSSDFPVKNPLSPNLQGHSDAFVTKINSSGTALVYSTYLGGSGDEAGRAIAVDSSGNAYVTGYTSSSDFPVVNPIYPNLREANNAFVTKMNASGTALVYSTYLGGSVYDVGQAIAVGGMGNAYVTGYTFSSDFPVQNPIYPNPLGGGDAFVTKIADSSLPQTGSLAVAILPQAAVSAGAMWSVDGGTSWNASGATVGSLAVGNYTLTFKPVTGWTTPANQTANISSGQLTSLTGTYVQPGHSLSGAVTSAGTPLAGVTVTLSGAEINTTVTDSSGKYSFANLANGVYTVTPSMNGYTFTPGSRSVNVKGKAVTNQNFTGKQITLPTISSISGYNDGVGVENGTWNGQGAACKYAHGNYYGYYAMESQSTSWLHSWLQIQGTGFGAKPGTVTASDPNIKLSISESDWSDNSITVFTKVPYTYKAVTGVKLYVKSSSNKTSNPFVMNVMGIIQTRGYGQCTWYVAYERLLHHLPFPNPGAFYAPGSIDYNYHPQQWDCFAYNTEHVSIITSAVHKKTVGNITTYTFTLGEMNATCNEAFLPYNNATFSVDASKQTYINSIGTNANKTWTATGYYR